MAPVAFPRLLKLGAYGQDVFAVGRALRNTEPPIRRYPATHSFGKGLQHQIKEFQRRHKILQTGIYGPRTHRALAPHFDAFGRMLMQQQWERLNPNLRQRIWAQALYSSRHHGVYAQERPIPHRWYDGIRTDCSGSVTIDYELGGGPDPNGLGFNGEGYTGTMIYHGARVTVPRMSDLVFYGNQGGGIPEHVVIAGGNGLCVTFGQNPGPVVANVGYRGDWNQARSYLP